MNHLVFLDSQASELEKILSGVKTMLVKELDAAQAPAHPVGPGDSLYFVRNKDEWVLRVRATVVRVLISANGLQESLSHTLKEMQPRLQLTEDQYNYWSGRPQVLLVEFESARKIDAIRVTPNQPADQTEWIAFEAFGLIMQKEPEANNQASPKNQGQVLRAQEV